MPKATIGETYNAGDMYNNFYYMKGSTSALRYTEYFHFFVVDKYHEKKIPCLFDVTPKPAIYLLVITLFCAFLVQWGSYWSSEGHGPNWTSVLFLANCS